MVRYGNLARRQSTPQTDWRMWRLPLLYFDWSERCTCWLLCPVGEARHVACPSFVADLPLNGRLREPLGCLVAGWGEVTVPWGVAAPAAIPFARR